MCAWRLNNLRVELACRGLSGEPLELQFEDRGGWLLASIPCRGWLTRFPPTSRKCSKSLDRAV